MYRKGSILDRTGLGRELDGVDGVIHIAAWHGIHESSGQRDVYAFWDLNVTGTFNVFEAAAQAGIGKIVYISSTSIRNTTSLYGHTKALGEEMARTYAARHGMNMVILRPRGFIPHWNRSVYTSFVEWAQWFWRGAVHIDDMAQAVLQSLDLLAAKTLEQPPVLVVDGAYEYTDDDLAAWDPAGPGSTFRTYYGEYDVLARQHGLDPAEKPFKYNLSETHRQLGYVPRYSLQNLLQELAHYGAAGPPNPYY
jgi:nucleoside-diphosphate-sugar epimerase